MFKVVDLFSGCGGLSLGFENAGFEVIAAFDNWKPAIETYTKNFDHPIFEGDLASSSIQEKIQNLKPDIIIGGPPCQDFSHAGKRDETLGRADLTLTFANIVIQNQPLVFVMENVDRALTSKRYKEAKSRLEANGYRIIENILDASLCGVPQKRKRLFVIGSKVIDLDEINKNIQVRQSKSPLSVREYFAKNRIPFDVEHYYRHPRNYSRRAIYSIDEPSATIRGVNRPVAKNYLGHSGDSIKLSNKIRPLNTLERSYIQTFPKSFVFEGPKTHLEQQIGNAVPVKLAEFVAAAVYDVISTRSTPKGGDITPKRGKQKSSFTV